ncbi:MAG TPA: nuclear transport factor 2 family protein [Mucilaginibacter sp.]|jgi:ketosteroid isomerase-like protein
MKSTNFFGKILLVWALLSCGAGFAQTATAQATRPQNGPNEKVVRSVYAAYEKKDWNMLTSLFAEGFTFTSPVDDRIDLKAYKVKCWPNAYNIKSFEIEKVVVDGDDVFVLYNGSSLNGKEFRNTEYFKLKDGKIKEFTCFFGPGISFPNNTKK